MAALGSQSIASSYEQLLHVDRDGGGNTTTLVNIKDGDNGTTFALQLATDKAQINGGLTIDANATDGTALTIDSEAQDGQGIYMDVSQQTSGYGILINDVGASRTTGGILYINSSQNNSGTRNLVEIKNVHAGATGTTALKIQQDSTAPALHLASTTHGADLIQKFTAENDSGTAKNFYMVQDPDAHNFRIYANVDPSLTIDGTAGNVGIGTASPSARLHLYNLNDATNNELLIECDSSSGGATGNNMITMKREDTNRANEIKFVTHAHGGSATHKFSLGQTDSDEAGVDGTEFYIGRASGGANPDFVINSSGNVGIGMSPDMPFNVRVGTDEVLRVRSDSGVQLTARTDNNGSDVALKLRASSFSFQEGDILPGVDDSQDIGSGSLRFDDIHATNGTIQTSDKNLKDNIADSSLGLDFLNALRPVEYKWKDYNYNIQKEEAVKAKDAVYETVVIQKAVEAKEAVIGTRQKTVSKEVEKTKTEIVEEDGKYIQKEVSYTETVKEPQYEEVDLYDKDNEVIGSHRIPIMEEYEVEPAIEAVEEITEERLVSEAIEAKDAVVETKEKTYVRKHFGLIAQEVEQVLKDSSLTNNDFAGLIYDQDADRYGLRYHELIAPLIKAVQELSAKITALENK